MGSSPPDQDQARAGRRVSVPRAPQRDVSITRGPSGPKPAGAAGLSERVTATPERKGRGKEHGWVLVSKSLTLPSAPPRVGGGIR